MEENSEPTVMPFVLTEHVVVIFSTFPFEISEDQNTVGERNKQTSKQKTPNSLPALSST